MIDITFTNQTQTKLPTGRFLTIIRQVLKKHGITDNVVVELKIVGSQHMQTLNRSFRHKDYATDVLSFPIWPTLTEIKKQSAAGQVLIGSVVICLPVAERDARNEHQPLLEKIDFLIEHSLLHLMGFHHEGDE